MPLGEGKPQPHPLPLPSLKTFDELSKVAATKLTLFSLRAYTSSDGIPFVHWRCLNIGFADQRRPVELLPIPTSLQRRGHEPGLPIGLPGAVFVDNDMAPDQSRALSTQWLL